MAQQTDRFGAVQLSPSLDQPLIMPVTPRTQESIAFTVVSALSLRAASKGITSNPICEVSLVKQTGRRTSHADQGQPQQRSQGISLRSPTNSRTIKSKVVESSMNPIWNLRVDFGVVDLDQVAGVKFVVRHVEPFVSTKLAHLWLPLHEVIEMLQYGGERTFDLQPPETMIQNAVDEQSSFKKSGKIVLRMDESSSVSFGGNPSVENSTNSSSLSGTGKRASIAHEDDFNEHKKGGEAHNALYELKQIHSFHQNNPRPGDIWFAIPTTWINDWLLFVSKHGGKDEFNPGAIPNNSLLANHSRDGTMHFRQGLQLKRDFRVVNQRTWEFYERLYGGGPAILLRVPADCQDTKSWLHQIRLDRDAHVASSYI